MVDLERGEIILGEKVVKIKKFEVWWFSPLGLHPTYHDAKDKMKAQDIPINMVLKPIPTAVGEGDVYECFGTGG